MSSPHEPPNIPANWPSDAKWVWHSNKKEYVKGIPQFNYMPNIDKWLKKRDMERKREVELTKAEALAEKKRAENEHLATMLSKTKAERAHLRNQYDPLQRDLAKGYIKWGDLVSNPPKVIPSDWPKDARWVWHPRKKKFVKGLKQFDYEPNIQNYLNRQRATRRRSRSRGPSRSHTRGRSRSHTRGRSGSRR